MTNSDLKISSKYKKPSSEELKKKLTPEQYICTQEGGTERPFQNPFWDLKDDGIYVDVVTGEPLFSSANKFDSGIGWPSFSEELEGANIVKLVDRSFGMERTEVKSLAGGSHLGHLFDDGPTPTGLRYCINSAALRFVPLNQMKAEGYGEHLFSFLKKKKWDIAIVAGGCYWGMEKLISEMPGVLETQVGFIGGGSERPTYEEVCSGKTGHAEAVRVLFDPAVVSYQEILFEFFRLHDPTTLNRQKNDVGTQYRSAVFYLDEQQKSVAEDIKRKVDDSGHFSSAVVTELVQATQFWPAHEDHQKYLEKYPDGYNCHIRRDLKF